MPSRDTNHAVGRAMRVGIMALGLFALTAPSAIILSSADASARERSAAKTDLGIFASLFTRSSGNRAINNSQGHGAFAMDASGVRVSFDSLTQQQQARVLQRCKDILAKPAQADVNQLALCQTVMTVAKR